MQLEVLDDTDHKKLQKFQMTALSQLLGTLYCSSHRAKMLMSAIPKYDIRNHLLAAKQLVKWRNNINDQRFMTTKVFQFSERTRRTERTDLWNSLARKKGR